MRMLIAEDERYLNRILKKQLAKEGYAVDSCENGSDALSCLQCAAYDAAVLDIMMPEMDGLTVLEKIRKQNIPVPVLLLTAKDAVEDRVRGLDAGADDYLTKPFSMEELLARLRVLMRRSQTVRQSVLSLHDLTLDPAAKTVRRAEADIHLSMREFSILEYMLRNAGQVLSRQQIEDHIWNYDYQGGSNVVDVYIRYLRQKIDDGQAVKLIHTVRGAGYVLKVKE